MALFYLDSSAIVKLIIDEDESAALGRFLTGAGLLSSELVLTEVPRAIKRAVGTNPQLPLDLLIDRAGQVLETIALAPADRAILLAGGALAEPSVRALDAIHIAAAIDLSPIDGFVSYDERQNAVARLSGLRTVSPR